MPRTSLAAATAELARRDPVLAALVARAGPVRLRGPNPDGPFGALARAIVFQQLAGAAATAIHRRFRALVEGPLTPEAVLELPEDRLRGAGLSAAKAAAIVDLATKVADGTVPLAAIRRLPDDDVVRHLTVVRGIGRWTAEMFLLFELRRPDVWPVDDYGVRSGYARAWSLPAPPPPARLNELGERFRPFRSVAAWYCWRAVELLPRPEPPTASPPGR